MYKKYRKAMAGIMSMIFFLQISSSPVLAADKISEPLSQTIASPEISLEKAIQIVKTNFEIPSELSNFTSNYNTSDERQAWSLHWNNPGKPGDFSAEVNAVNGDILSLNYWRNDDSAATTTLPVLTKTSAQKISDDLLTRLLGDRAGQIKLLTNNQEILPLNNYGPISYSFQYQRLINDIPMLGNGVNVQVSSDDGHIISYNLNWSDLKVPENKGVISAGQAEQALASAPFFKLLYWLPTPYRILDIGQKQEAKLVYQLSGQTGGAIDAFTGEPLKLNPGDWIAQTSLNVGIGSKGGLAGSAASQPPVLTPQEQQEVDRTAKLLKQDEAIAAVQRWIGIPDNLTLRSANLSTDWRSADNRVWSFDWSNPNAESTDGKAQYLSARIDASNGELLGFNLTYPQTDKKSTELDRTAMQKLAEDFLKKVQPSRFSQVALDSDSDTGSGVVSDQVKIIGPISTCNFSYHRIVNGVDFPNNTMTVDVEPSTGTITGYELNWSDLDFPTTSGILSKDQAVKAFLALRPMTLTYVRIYSNGVPGEVRLVYLLLNQDQSTQNSNIIDARSGEMLDYQGQPLEKSPKPYSFTDISRIEGEQEIMALGQAGLFGDFGNSFKPNETMSLASLLRAMYLSRFGLGKTLLCQMPKFWRKLKNRVG
ncbi:YcdB/YcdC domain-containing protein [Desulfosporosinus sp. SB140]|uniref:YcdB/YcdC domain-containing protein n=1 Tax=Desulfosporosinus paludis TaxID=3115649 RepID=UPI00388CFC57